LSFDFYDDWDEEDTAASRGLLGGWGNDELDRLLAGSGSHSGGSEGVDQPRRKRGMSYGTRGRRKSLDPDPTVIPSTSALGFLGRLPFKLGGTLRYKPSAADLQEHPGAPRAEFREEEGELLISDEHSEDERDNPKGHTRNRSSTTSSGETSDSFRSRGDIFPSDGEDDAVPLSDEFAMVIERRMTGTNADDRSSGKTRSSKGKRPAASRNISRNLSRTTQSSNSNSRPSLAGRRVSSGASLPHTPDILSPNMAETPSLTDLQQEEERVRHEEEVEVERKRQAAVKLAVERGLHAGDTAEVSISESKAEPPVIDDIPPLPPSEEETTEAATADSEVPAAEAPLSRVDSKAPTVTSEANPPEEPAKHDFVPARLPFFN
jgi:hypothetical protein